jgi:hypothetical protein
MRVPNAVWKFATTHGNDYARKYANANNSTLQSSPRGTPSGCADMVERVCEHIWLSLPTDERNILMEKTPDTTFPDGTTGVMDQRFGRKRKETSDAPLVEDPQRVQPKPNPEGRPHRSSGDQARGSSHRSKKTDVLIRKTVAMRNARAAYHRLASKEHMLKLQTEYD